jgi:hypothetical protein
MTRPMSSDEARVPWVSEKYPWHETHCSWR